MQKAAEDLKRQQEEEEKIKRAVIEQRVPKLQIDGLSQGITAGTMTLNPQNVVK